MKPTSEIEDHPRGTPGPRRWNLALPTLLLASLSAGCASERGHTSPMNSTLGTDPSTVPPGQSFPPAGFGVDLAASPAGRSPTAALWRATALTFSAFRIPS